MGARPLDWAMTLARRATLVKKSPVSAAGSLELELNLHFFLSPSSPRSFGVDEAVASLWGSE